MSVHVSYLGTGKTSRSFGCPFEVLCQVVPKRKGLILRHSVRVIPMSVSTSGSKVRIPSRDLVIELRNRTREFTDARDSAGTMTLWLCRGIGRKAIISVSRRELSKRRMGVRMFVATANAEGCSRLSEHVGYPPVYKGYRFDAFVLDRQTCTGTEPDDWGHNVRSAAEVKVWTCQTDSLWREGVASIALLATSRSTKPQRGNRAPFGPPFVG